jgi:hypothetical protein
MIKRALATFIVLLGASVAYAQGPAGGRAFLDQYCVGCHNARTQTADLMLDGMDLGRIEEKAEVWEKVVRKLRAGMMPPYGARRPDAGTIEKFTASLEGELDRSKLVGKLQLQSPGVHRLNRTEYANAIRDLLDLEVDTTALLPPDSSSFGFDNMAESLSINSTLLERYLSAASRISRLAVGDVSAVSKETTYAAPGDLSQNEHIDGLPFGTRGGMLIHHNFPADGEYVFQIALLRGTSLQLFGADAKGQLMELSIDGERVKVFDLDVEQRNTVRIDNIPQPMQLRVPLTAGAHAIGVAFIQKGHNQLDDVFSSAYLRSQVTLDDRSRTTLPHINRVTIVGPYNSGGVSETASRRKIFICHPKETGTAEATACAERIITNLTERAYRRPVTREHLEILMSFYHAGEAKGRFDDGIELALRRILASPEFVFRLQQPAGVKPGESYRINDVELASRLSFFLWSSIPDQQLLDLAERGRLRNPGVLESQVRRMLADSRSKALAQNFAGQWLYLRNLQSASPDLVAFPGFDDNLRQAMRQETELFFDTVVREDRSVLDLLTGDYTFVNQRLARHYGIPGVYGDQFRRVTLGPETHRRGLLGQGSVLTVTSQAARTSPVSRGKWVLENILGTPPPEPPANVPPLDNTGDNAIDLTKVSLRARMEAHRQNPACSGCHRIMDPIGFSLENFDAIGRWRTRDGSSEINATGELADGTRLDGPLSLHQALMQYTPQFLRTVTGKLLTYGLGRGVQYYDMPLVRQIVRQAESDNYRFSSLVLGIVKSAPFQSRTNPPRSEIAGAR